VATLGKTNGRRKTEEFKDIGKKESLGRVERFFRKINLSSILIGKFLDVFDVRTLRRELCAVPFYGKI